MKTTPIYILLIIFFLNFDLAWGMLGEERTYAHLVQTLFSLQETNDEYFLSFNIVYSLSSIQTNSWFNKNIVQDLHRLRLNVGWSNALAELDYEYGLYYEISNKIDIIPYLALGTNIYSVGYGGGIDVNIAAESGLKLTCNINYRTTDKLFGHTNAQQWYQSGFGAKLGVSAAILSDK